MDDIATLEELRDWLLRGFGPQKPATWLAALDRLLTKRAKSCGCVFCDLLLIPDVEIDGAQFHHLPTRGNILCERKPPKATADE